MTLKDLMKNSVLPESYKVNRINEDANNRGRSKDNASRRDRNKDSSASKYTYSKQNDQLIIIQEIILKIDIIYYINNFNLFRILKYLYFKF